LQGRFNRNTLREYWVKARGHNVKKRQETGERVWSRDTTPPKKSAPELGGSVRHKGRGKKKVPELHRRKMPGSRGKRRFKLVLGEGERKGEKGRQRLKKGADR